MNLHRKLKLTASALVLVLLLAFTLGNTGCPKSEPQSPKKLVAQAAEVAKDVGGSTRDVIKAVGQAYDQKLITLEQKDKYADLLIKISEGGQKGVSALTELEKHVGETGQIPADKWQLLNALFNSELVTPFLNFLTEINKLTPEANVAIQVSVIALRSLILRLSDAFGRRAELEQKFQLAGGTYVNAE